MPNLVCGSWISAKYRTLYCLNITYYHTYHDVHKLPCLFTVTSLWRQSLFTLWLRCYWQGNQAVTYPLNIKSLRW